MLKEFVDKILSLGTVEYKEHAGQLFATKSLVPVLEHKFYPATLEVESLTALADYLNSVLDNQIPDLLGEASLAALIASPFEVHLISTLDEHEKRQTLMRAKFRSECFGFKFGMYNDPERFIIDLASNFERNPDLDEIIALASGITVSSEVSTDDDGLTQNVTVKKGVVTKQSKTIKNPYTLIPRRSFAEIKHPDERFIFRVKDDHGDVVCALFEASGAQWRLNTMTAIKDWLKSQELGCTIIG
jgi:hypothetical protein